MGALLPNMQYSFRKHSLIRIIFLQLAYFQNIFKQTVTFIKNVTFPGKTFSKFLHSKRVALYLCR
jgi:hypothetical protein